MCIRDSANLVEGLTKISGIEFSTRKEKQAGNFMKMLLSVAKDIRVIIIKFADRMHNMNTITHMPKIKQRRIAIETRDVYSPLAHRLGMASVKSKLDDLAFQVLNKVEYESIASKLKTSNKQRKKLINSYGDGSLVTRNDVFFSLCKSIIGQQISVAAANSVFI